MSIDPISRAGAVLAFGLLVASGASRCSFAQTPDPCAGTGQDRGHVESIDANLEILLSDGRRVMIAGIEPLPIRSTAVGSDAARQSLNEWLVGQDIVISPLQKTPDRWGRTLANISGPPESDGSAMMSVAYALIDAGWARV